mgnify:CR=1 FL=1
MTQTLFRAREEPSGDTMTRPRPQSVDLDYRGTGKLDGKVALISSGKTAKP